MTVVAGFPSPVDFARDHAARAIGSAASGGFDVVFDGLQRWTIDGAVWAFGQVFSFFVEATDPDVQAAWFARGDGPYATTLAIGGALLVLFVLLSVAQGVLNGDVAGMMRRFALDLPLSVLGMVSLITITQVLIRLTDDLSVGVLGHFQGEVDALTDRVAELQNVQTTPATGLIVFLLALVTALAGLVVVAELVVRSALIYVVVALAPLVFATRLWPATRGIARKLVELLCALVLSKLVVAVALSVAASAAVGPGAGSEGPALRPPEAVAPEAPGDPAAQTVGLLLSAAATFGIAAFSPLLIARLMPVTEAAVVAHGIKGGPIRAGQQGLMLANTAQMVSGHRLNQLASRSSAGPPSGMATGGGSAAGAAGGMAAAGSAAGAGAVHAARAINGATRRGASVATRTATPGDGASAPSSGRASQRRDAPPVTPPRHRSHPKDHSGVGDGR